MKPLSSGLSAAGHGVGGVAVLRVSLRCLSKKRRFFRQRAKGRFSAVDRKNRQFLRFLCDIRLQYFYSLKLRLLQHMFYTVRI